MYTQTQHDAHVHMPATRKCAAHAILWRVTHGHLRVTGSGGGWEGGGAIVRSLRSCDEGPDGGVWLCVCVYFLAWYVANWLSPPPSPPPPPPPPLTLNPPPKRVSQDGVLRQCLKTAAEDGILSYGSS